MHSAWYLVVTAMNKMLTAFGLLVLCALGARHVDADAVPWSPQTFPNPMLDTKACGRGGIASRVCDPDGLLSRESANVVEGIIQDIETAKQPYRESRCDDSGDSQGYQVRSEAVPLPHGPYPVST